MLSSIRQISPVIALSFALSACTVTKFDVPQYENAPTVRSIVQRVECELVGMVAGDGDSAYKHQSTLLTGNYQVGVNLSLTVLDNGQLAPSFSYLPNAVFSLNGGLNLAKSREQNFNQTYFFSMATLRHEWEINHDFGHCPKKDTDLAGDLGIRQTVTMALDAPGRKVDSSLSGAQGEFGGYVKFTVTKGVNSFGPTWTLTHFKGPGSAGGILSLSEVNTDTLTFGFAAAPPEKKKGAQPNKPSSTAVDSANSKIRLNLQQLYLQQLSLPNR